MSRLPAGQYVHGTTVLHQLDAFAKLLCFLVLLAAIILTDSLPGFLLMGVFTIALLRLSGLSFRSGTAAIRRLWLFFVVIFLMNTLFFETENTLLSFGIFHVSVRGMVQGATVVLRVILVMICATVLTSVTPPMKLTAAIETLLTPLGWLHIPIGEVAMILGVALQFIPTFIEEADHIKKAQSARGALFESDRLRDRALSVVPLVVPVFLSAFRRADELSTAMEARGYRGASHKKRKKHPSKNETCCRWPSSAGCAYYK